MRFIQYLKNLDRIFVVLINHDSTARFMDPFMIAVRDPLTWIPLYVFVGVYTFAKFRRYAWMFIALSIVTVVVTDMTAFLLFKPLVHRLRPCCDPVLSECIRSLVNCGGKYSFPSNHAANHTGLTCFWIFAIRKITGEKWTWILIWPAAIGYAQVYVGQHFPSDILAGALLGCMIALFTAWIFRLWCRSKGLIGVDGSGRITSGGWRRLR